ncbi:hypothetical protein [uncultured Ruminococcus sp.]|uniref:hypothetical protein n=1 Tax=uncultured Ruminococcus sp. TaxID=165186 RepID=UPI0025D9C9F0|nr:hypothetical protein [uncultured Ruminococcus sp.]
MITKEEFEKAVDHCNGDTITCCGCPLYGKQHHCVVYLTEYIKENEPAPAVTDTSSEVSLGDTKKILAHLDDSTLLDICQEALRNIADRVAEVNGGDDYIQGYANAVTDVVDRLKGAD